MNIYRISALGTFEEYAQFYAEGRWIDGRLCKTCGASIAALIPPLIIEWGDGTDTIGDFSWSNNICAVTRRVVELCQSINLPCEFHEAIQLPTPVAKTARKKRRPMPHSDEPLYGMFASTRIPRQLPDYMSGVQPCRDCQQWRLNLREDDVITIDRADWHGEGMFHILQANKFFSFVTEDTKQAFEANQLSNIKFTHVGRIVS